MGDVYRARDTTLGRDVAIKILPDVFTADANRRARFEREVRLLAALNHPHIGAISRESGLESQAPSPKPEPSTRPVRVRDTADRTVQQSNPRRAPASTRVRPRRSPPGEWGSRARRQLLRQARAARAAGR